MSQDSPLVSTILTLETAVVGTYLAQPIDSPFTKIILSTNNLSSIFFVKPEKTVGYARYRPSTAKFGLNHLVWILLVLFMGMGEACADLYCVVDFSGQRCIYPDLASCKGAVGESGGSCILNRSEMIAPVGGAAFCLVEQWKTECLYRDRASCERLGAARGAICIANPNLAAEIPYTINPPIADDWGSGHSLPGGDRYLPSPGYDPRPGAR
ncbi:MAG: hypothetical protein HQL67_07560 [Magnetococcales bacterium]|nr:hypothetical protein [Magnetococcales bacterium]